MPTTWTSQMEKRLIELSSGQASESQMAEVLNDEFGTETTRNSVHNKLSRLDINDLISKPHTVLMPYYDKYRDVYDGGKDGPGKIVEIRSPWRYSPLTRPCKILCLNDLHIPFQVEDQIQEAINKHRAADIVVLSEIADCYSLSRFDKSRSIPLEVEIDEIVRLFEYLNETFPLTIVLEANHTLRAAKMMMRMLPPVLLSLVEANMLVKLARPFRNVVVVPNWFIEINDALIGHGEKFSKIDMRTVVNIYDFFNEWWRKLGLTNFNLIVQGHTHRQGTVMRAGGLVKVMESGALCYIPDYSVNRMMNTPQVNGYVVIQQDRNGVTDFNATREYVLNTPTYKQENNDDGFLGLR